MARIVAIALVLEMALGAAGWAQGPPERPGDETYRLQGLGTLPTATLPVGLLRRGPIREELGMTDGQRAASEYPKLLAPFRAKIRAGREIEDPERRTAADEALMRQIKAAEVAILTPEQQDRLEQIELQLQGPEAFLLPRLRNALRLTPEQVATIRPIVEEGRAALAKASAVPLPPGMKGDDAEVRLDPPEFRAALERARRATRAAWEATVRRILGELTEAQRADYEARCGAPFNMARLRADRDDFEAALQLLEAGSVVLDQGADPDFDPGIDRPAYAAGAHPRVLFDEAHHNFHTARGRYKPFVDLILADGYRVTPVRKGFTRSALERGDILVIANALGAEGMRSPGAQRPAFTEGECEAVRAWVRDGGALLLVSDLPPTGSAAAGLAARFGVEMSRGLASDPQHSERFPTHLVFSRENGLLRDHPITLGRDESERVGRVMTFAGQSLRGPEGSVSFLTLGETATDSQGPGGEPIPAAGRSQGLAFRYGKGRVVVLGEAGQLSAQVEGPARAPMGMNVPGVDNRTLALNLMHWLSGLLEPAGD